MRSTSVAPPTRRSTIELGNALPRGMHRHDHPRAFARRTAAHGTSGSHSERAGRAKPDSGGDNPDRSRRSLRARTESFARDGVFQGCRSTAADGHGGHQHRTQRGSWLDRRQRAEARDSFRRTTCIAADRPFAGRLHHRRRPRRPGRDGSRRVSRFAQRCERGGRTRRPKRDHCSRHSKRAHRGDWRAGWLLSLRRPRAGARRARRAGSPRCRPGRRPGLSSSPRALGSDVQDPSQLVRRRFAQANLPRRPTCRAGLRRRGRGRGQTAA